MPTTYSLAGPDLGVRRVNAAELFEALGTDEAIEAAQQAEKVQVWEVPGANPRRRVRIYQPGDENMEWSDFQELGPVATRTPGAQEDDDSSDEDETASTGRRALTALAGKAVLADAVDVDADHVLPQDEKGRNIYLAEGSFQISVPFTLWVRALSVEDAKRTLHAAMHDEKPPKGGAVNWDPEVVARNVLALLQQADGNYAEAGWTMNLDRVGPPKRKFWEKIVAEKMFDGAVHRAIMRMFG